MVSQDFNLFSEKIFAPYWGCPEEDYIDGSERMQITDPDQRNRWDFFFRPDINKIKTMDAEDYNRFRKSYGKALLRVAMWAILFIPFTIGGVWVASEVAVNPLLGTIAGLIPLIILMVEVKRASRLKSGMNRIDARRDELLQQVPKNLPTEEWMRIQLDRLLNGLDKVARGTLNIHKEDITVKLEPQNDQQHDSSNPSQGNCRQLEKRAPMFYEWALIQHKKVIGKKSLNSDHLISFRDDLFCCYYVQFLYPTSDYIASYGTYVDLITFENFGRIDHEFYYKLITNIGTRMIEMDSVENFFFVKDKQPFETLRFSMMAASGEKILVTFVDPVLRRKLAKHIEDLEIARKERYEELLKKAKLKHSTFNKEDIEEELNKVREAAERLKDDQGLSQSERIIKDIRKEIRNKQQEAE